MIKKQKYQDRNINKDYRIFIKKSFIILTFLNGVKTKIKIILNTLRIKNWKEWKTLNKF
jgi:hypothetical protein